MINAVTEQAYQASIRVTVQMIVAGLSPSISNEVDWYEKIFIFYS